MSKAATFMHSYDEICSQVDMDRLLDSLARFHDSLTKEIHLINRAYVRSDKSMVGGHRFDAQILIQSQWKPFAIELLLMEIENLQLSGPGEYWGASGTVEVDAKPVDKTTITMSFDSRFRVVCGRLFHRVRDGWLGKEAFLKSEIPSTEMVPANFIEGSWRQCSACKDAWEASSSEVFSHCTNCGILTHLVPVHDAKL